MSAILLVSFITQQYLFECWRSQSDNLHEAILELPVVDKSVLLNEVLYFVVGVRPGTMGLWDTSAVPAASIREAARKAAMSESMPVLYSDSLDTAKKSDLVKSLYAPAASVSDYDGLLGCFDFIDGPFGDYGSDLNRQLSDIGRYREWARNVYLLLYLAGSLFLLWGTGREYRIVNRPSGTK